MVRALQAIVSGGHWEERSNRSIFFLQGFADRTFLSKLYWVRVRRAIDRPTTLLVQVNSPASVSEFTYMVIHSLKT